MLKVRAQFLGPGVQRFAVTCLGYGLVLTEWHDEEVSRLLSTEDGLPERAVGPE